MLQSVFDGSKQSSQEGNNEQSWQIEDDAKSLPWIKMFHNDTCLKMEVLCIQ